MIYPIDLTDSGQVLQLLELQTASYLIEAELIGYTDLPPLRDSISSLRQSGETFYGDWEDGDGELRGAVSYSRTGGDTTICRLMVHPGHFRKGIAGRLLEFAFQLESDSSRFFVSTGSANKPAVQLYTKYGFVRHSERPLIPGVSLTTFVKTGRPELAGGNGER